MTMLSPRLSVLIFFSIAFSLVLSGLLSVFVAFPLTALLFFLLHSQCHQQLPQERLNRFAEVFALTPDPVAKVEGERADRSGKHGQDRPHRIILHRGGNVDAPENTLEAIREAAKQGVAGVEVDLQFTADGVGILLHDDTLDRTTDATGDVRKKQFSDLKDVNAAAKHDKSKHNGSTVKIPTLEECLTECLRLNLLVFIDCKAFADNTANLVDELFNKYPDLYNIAAVCSFYPNIVYAMRKKNPRVITALTYRKMSLSCEQDCLTPRFSGLTHYWLTLGDYLNMWMTYAWSWWLCGNSFLLLNKESLCQNEVNWWRHLGIHLVVWTVNSETEKRFCLDHLNIPYMTDDLNTA